MTETDAQRIDRLGLTDTISALEDLWDTRTLYYLQDERTADLARYGYGPLDAFDAIWHALEASDAHRYMQHGFTAHQALLLSGNAQARRNLFDGEPLPGGTLNEHTNLPRDLLAKILLVAKSRDETRAFIDGCTGTGPGPDGTEDPAAVTAQVELLAGLLADPVDTCDCEHPWSDD